MADKFHLVAQSTLETLYAFHCPGCECAHIIPVTGPCKWNWNGDLSSPTLTPSILVNRATCNPTAPVCHSFVTNGSIQFLTDSTHKLAGQTVLIPDWDVSPDPPS